MAGFEETVGELVRRQALYRDVTYGMVKTHAKSGRHETTRLLAEVMRRCREYGLDMKRITSSVPEHMRARKELQQFFPPRVPKKRGGKKAEPKPKPEKKVREILGPKGYSGGAGIRTVPRMEARDEWARRQGYKSWRDFWLSEYAKSMGYTRGGEAMARAKRFGQRYLALLASLYRARIPDAERLANLIMPQKYPISRKKLAGDARRLAELPLLPAGKPKKMLDTSLPKYRKVWKKFNLPKYRKQWKK